MSRVHLATRAVLDRSDAERLNRKASDDGRPAVPGAALSDVDAAGHQAEVEHQRLAQAVRGCWSAGGLFDLPLGGKVVLVVSSVRSEGASTVARGLARRLDETGNGRVLLVDANLRRPSQHLAFGVTGTRGLAELLEKTVPAGHQVVLNQSEGGFALLPCGTPPQNPAQLLSRPETAQVFRALSSRFDWIVVDGPPITVYPDAAILANVADAAILVVKAEATRQEVIAQAKRTLEESGVRLLGAVLNRQHQHIPEFVYRHLLRDDSGRGND